MKRLANGTRSLYVTGLGLAVTAELVRLHGGTITLEETPAGACFRIVIPDRV